MQLRQLITAYCCLAVALPLLAIDDDAGAARVRQLADGYYQMQLEAHPELVLFYGLETPDPGGITSNRQSVMAHVRNREAELLKSLLEIDQDRLRGQPEWITYGILEQSLQSSQGMWVCRNDLWNINHMSGWQLMFPRLMELQPIGNDEVRLQTLMRMSDMVAFIKQEMANLQYGLEQGYSAPRSVVSRVIQQVDAVVGLDHRESPLLSPVWRDDSEGFTRQALYFYTDETIPSWQAYRDFLAEEYLPQARESLSVSTNPDGRDCYEASLRYYTTLGRSPEQVYQLGKDTVEANRKRVEQLGKAAYGLDDFASIMAQIRNDSTDKFTDADHMLEFSRNTVARAESAMPDWFGTIPGQAVQVEPFPDYQEGTGVVLTL